MQLTSAGILLGGEQMTSVAALSFSFDPVAENLLAQGLHADKTLLMMRLESIGEYRLTSYADYFRSGSGYSPGTTLEKVWRIYEFDRCLRSLCFEAIGNIEIYVRSMLVYRFGHRHGPSDYLNQANFPNFSLAKFEYSWWEGKIKEVIAGEQKDRPNAPQPFPIWEIAERMDFGTTLSFFKGAHSDIRKEIANAIGQADVVLESWLLGLRDLRNRCAHHHRIWNWHFGGGVSIPRRRNFPQWHTLPWPSNQQIGILLTICRYWLNRIHLGNDWTKRVLALFDSYPDAPAAAMGLPQNWRKHPLWRS